MLQVERVLHAQAKALVVAAAEVTLPHRFAVRLGSANLRNIGVHVKLEGVEGEEIVEQLRHGLSVLVGELKNGKN